MHKEEVHYMQVWSEHLRWQQHLQIQKKTAATTQYPWPKERYSEPLYPPTMWHWSSFISLNLPFCTTPGGPTILLFQVQAKPTKVLPKLCIVKLFCCVSVAFEIGQSQMSSRDGTTENKKDISGHRNH